MAEALVRLSRDVTEEDIVPSDSALDGADGGRERREGIMVEVAGKAVGRRGQGVTGTAGRSVGSFSGERAGDGHCVALR